MPTVARGLTEAQLDAARHPGGPLLVVGGAGTGKTRTLMARFEWLAKHGTPADSILALTFSSSAANRMRERLEGCLAAPFEELCVTTFHGFCARMLHDEAIEAGLDPFFAAVTPADRLALMLDRIDDLTLRRHEIRGNPAPLLASFIARIDLLKDELITCREYSRYAAELIEDASGDAARVHAGRELEFARLYADHDRLLAERGALDHGDLILHAFRLLHEKPHVRGRLALRYRHVLVDDYQDLSFSQGMVLRMLCESHRNVTAAADDDQAIHRTRAAAQKNIVDFQREYEDAHVVRLEHNQRSGRQILKAACAVVAPIEGRIDKRLRGRSGGEVLFWHSRSDRAQAQQVAAEAERLITTEGVSPEEICALVRSVRDEGPVLGAAFEERGVPFTLTGAAAYFQRAEVRDVLAWLRLLADPGDSGAVVRALSRPPVELRSVDIARLTQLSRRRKIDMVAGIEAALETPQLSPEGRDRAMAFLRVYRSASRAFEEMAPDAFVHRLIERIGLRRRQVFAAQADTVERLVNIAKLADLARDFMQHEPGSTARDFTRYVAAVAEAGLPEDEAAPPNLPSGVQVMNIESAKGLEFDHAFVVGLSAQRMPGARRVGGDDIPEALLKESLPEVDARVAHEAEMRRLLHVAMTRARNGLVLSWAESGE